MAVGRRDLLALSLQYAALYRCRQHDQIRGRTLSCDPAQPEPSVQGATSLDHSHSLYRADGSVGDRLLVALRRAIFDHLLVASASRPDRSQHQLPGRRLERPLVGDLCQYLAWRAVRRDYLARRPADGSTVA